MAKTKEIVVDFSNNKSPPASVCISGKDVEIVTTFKFLGVQLENKLEWSTNTEATQVLQCLQQDAPHVLLVCQGIIFSAVVC